MIAPGRAKLFLGLGAAAIAVAVALPGRDRGPLGGNPSATTPTGTPAPVRSARSPFALMSEPERASTRTAASCVGWVRDPFHPALARTEGNSAVTLPGQVRLEGVLWDPWTPRALIGGRVVTIGATTPFGCVTDIQEDHVVIEKDGKKCTLRF